MDLDESSHLYVISNTSTTFEAQFIKKLSNTETEMKKCVASKKKPVFPINLGQKVAKWFQFCY